MKGKPLVDVLTRIKATSHARKLAKQLAKAYGVSETKILNESISGNQIVTKMDVEQWAGVNSPAGIDS